MNDQPSPQFEREQEELNPHREEERRRVAQETIARLTARGIMLTGRESPDELADLISAVENFEQEVDDHGGDLMVDDLRSTEPDDPHFVLPARHTGEGIGSYIARIDEAADHLRGHPAHPD
jgi:hypothetical protein